MRHYLKYANATLYEIHANATLLEIYANATSLEIYAYATSLEIYANATECVKIQMGAGVLKFLHADHKFHSYE